MENKSLTIEVDSSNVEIEYRDKMVCIHIHNNMAIKLEMDNDVLLESHGDFSIVAGGELSFISSGEPICIDSIDSVIHMNYRESKLIKHLPESIIYKQKIVDRERKNTQIATMQEMQNKTLKERVSILEDKIKKLGG